MKYEGHSISNAILTIMFCLNTLLKIDLVFLKHKFNLPSARQLNTSAETQSGLPFVLHLRQKCNFFVFSFFLVYNNV